MAETQLTSTKSQRYTRISIVLHWLIALKIIALLFFGKSMESVRERAILGEISFEQVEALFNWHKTLGISVLVLTCLRIFWRLKHLPPPLPAHVPLWQKQIAKLTHLLFYGLLIILPLGGWALASSTNFPSKLFNLDTLTLFRLPIPQTDFFYSLFGTLHTASGNILILLLLLHIAGALKHHFVDRDGILQRMLPWLNIPRQNR